MTDPATPARPRQPWTTTLDGRQLRRLRHQHGLSQEQLATCAGISLTTIRRLEHQPAAPCRSRTLGRLATALGEDPGRLDPRRPTLSGEAGGVQGGGARSWRAVSRSQVRAPVISAGVAGWDPATATADGAGRRR